MIRHLAVCLALTLLYGNAAYAAEPAETLSTVQDQQSITVTIYNDNLALVRDQRKVKLQRGNNHLALGDVSAQIQPETALLRSITAPGSISVHEQNFDFDLLTPQKLLEEHVGKTVSIVRTNPASGAETTEQALVLSANNGVVLKIGDRIETEIPGRIVYGEVPSKLHDRPTLVTQLENTGPENQKIELSYLTTGLAWKADYVAELNAAESMLDLSGWITLTNTSDIGFHNARLQLVAGNVNLVKDRPAMADMRAKTMAMAESAQFAEETLLDYHLYTLDRPATLAKNQTKQVALLSAVNIPVRKEYLLRGADYYYRSSHDDLGQKMKAGIFIEFDNTKDTQLDMPLPAGILRVYKEDTAGAIQFVGENRIGHTPRNETIRLKLGEAFDITADKKQTDFKKLAGSGKQENLFESAYSIVIRNAKAEAVTVTVQEPIPGDWRMLQSSHSHKKPTSNIAEWQIKVPAEGSTTLSYRVQASY